MQPAQRLRVGRQQLLVRRFQLLRSLLQTALSQQLQLLLLTPGARCTGQACLQLRGGGMDDGLDKRIALAQSRQAGWLFQCVLPRCSSGLNSRPRSRSQVPIPMRLDSTNSGAASTKGTATGSDQRKNMGCSQ